MQLELKPISLVRRFEVVSNFLQLCKISQHKLNCGLYSAILYNRDERLADMLLNAGAKLKLKSKPIGKVSLSLFEPPSSVLMLLLLQK